MFSELREKIMNFIKKWRGVFLFGLLPCAYLAGLLEQALMGFLNNTKVSLNPFICIWSAVSTVVGIVFLAVVIFLFFSVINYFTDDAEDPLYDADRNLTYSEKGTYGTSGYMDRDEKLSTLNQYNTPEETSEIILGKDMDDDKILTVPENARMNRHIAVYGASGTGKSRALARPFMLQRIKKGESFVVTDPKGELYSSMSSYLRDNGYDVKVLNLKNLEHSDSWNCLAEIGGDDLKAQIFCDVIIQNTSAGSNGDFWALCEMNLLKALCLYVEKHPTIPTAMSEVYELLTTKKPFELDAIFDELPMNQENKAMKMAYNIFKEASDNIKGGVIIGLGSRLQVFQGNTIDNITRSSEIDLVKLGKEKCAYFCVTSDQHSAFNFIAVLFYSMLFIKLVEFADSQPDACCPVSVNFVLDEFPNIGAIPDFTKKISTVRSRGLNMIVIFQNIAQLQNRYPYGQWEEILGNCDLHICLGCTDETTAKFVSDKTGVVTIQTSSHSYTQKDSFFGSAQVNEKESESVGKRNLLTPDEVLRIDIDKELIFIRGHKPLMAKKFDFSLHPDAPLLQNDNVDNHIPLWKKKMDEENSYNESVEFEENGFADGFDEDNKYSDFDYDDDSSREFRNSFK